MQQFIDHTLLKPRAGSLGEVYTHKLPLGVIYTIEASQGDSVSYLPLHFWHNETEDNWRKLECLCLSEPGRVSQ